MATTREQFIALRKSGMTPVQAKEEVMKTVTPVSPTTNANVAQLEANRARVQSQIASGERPAVGTSVTPQAEQTQAPTPPPAPVATTTPSGATMNADWTVTPANPVAPVTPTTPTVTTTTTPAPVTPKVEPVKTPVVDYTQAQWREQEIMSNLEKFKTQWMTPDQIKWASGYENATPEKKAIIEWFLNPVKQDAGTIFSTLRAGGSVPMSDTPEYRQAQARYNTFKRFSTYDVASLSTAMQQGDLLMGTQAYNDVISDPNMLAKIQKARIFMNGEVDMVKIGEKQGQYVMTQNPTVAKALEDGYITTEEYNAMTSTPEVEAQAKVVSEAKTKYDEYKRQLEQIDDDVDKEYEGKETTDSFRSAIKANRDKAVRRLYNSASDDLQNASGLYTELKNSSTQRLELNMKQYEQQQADARQLASEERAVQRSKDALQYEADFNKKQAQEALNDPAIAIKSVMDEYKKLGIPFTSTVQSRLAEFKASGKPLEQFLTEMGQNIQQSPAYKQYQAQQAGKWISYETIWDKVYKNTNGVLTETGISAKSAPTPVWQEWEDATGKHAGWVTPGVTPSTSTATAVKPTGNIVPVTAGNKTVRLDQSGAGWFESAINQLTTAGIPIVVWQGARDQSATIKEMADRYGIPFNSSNPAETAWKLRKAGHQVADPWKSNHESGMAIDVYWDSKLWKVSPAQEKILNANWWYSAGIPGDAGHFEYRGGGTGAESTTIDIPAYQKYLNSWALPTGIKAGTPQANEWLQGYSQWKWTANPLSDSVQKRVDSYSDDYSKNANVVSAFKFAPLLRQYDKVKVSDLSSSQRQGIISDYAKALDPDSVVREGEYATVAKYSSSWGEKTLSEINQFLSGNGTLSDAAAQKVIDAIKSRGKNYVEQEKNIRNQYIEKINRATGYKDWDTQLVYPDYSTPTTQSNSKLSALMQALANIAKNAPKQ